jgi:hypothetical protein
MAVELMLPLHLPCVLDIEDLEPMFGATQREPPGARITGFDGYRCVEQRRSLFYRDSARALVLVGAPRGRARLGRFVLVRWVWPVPHGRERIMLRA